MSYVKLKSVSKHYGKEAAVKYIDLSVDQGEFFSLLGPSGCGKSTTLRLLAGFVEPDKGQVIINGINVTQFPPEKRNIGIVFQNYAIFPHMTVAENISFGLKMRKVATSEIKKKSAAVLEQVGLSGFEKRYERELSGGQKQRVALARVLVIEPEILLLDEPLSALDKKMREEMKLWIKTLQQSINITTVYVTHDQGEALTMSDRIAVMDKGEILQIGTPTDIYHNPKNRFIGEFIGESSVIFGKVVSVNDQDYEVLIGDNPPIRVFNKHHPNNYCVGDKISLLIRPEAITINKSVNIENRKLKGIVVHNIYQGSSYHYVIDIGDQQITVEIPDRPDANIFEKGDQVNLYWNNQSSVILN